MESEKKYTAEDFEDFIKWAETQKKATVKDWEESKKEEVFKPEFNGKYAIITNELEIIETENTLVCDEKRIKANNCFKSVEKANKIPVKLFFAMWRWKLSNDDVELDWGNEKTYKYMIHYPWENKRYEVNSYYSLNNKIAPYFSTKEKAESCIKWLEKQNLL